jgi:3-oxoacyl-[acyl-carrier protein] reductase
VTLFEGSLMGCFLSQNGATVILNSHSDPRFLQERAEELQSKSNAPVSFQHADFSDPKQIWNCYRTIHQVFGGVDIVVNNAGIFRPALLGMIPEESIHDSFNLNTVGVIHSMQGVSCRRILFSNSMQ